MENKVIDLRSDTVTLPSIEMKQAMINACLGDDVFGDDPTVNEFQKWIAIKLGKECALINCSGTMSNLLAVMTHCWNGRDHEVILGDKSHIHLHEQGGMATIAGVHHRTVPNLNDGTFDLELFRSYIRGDDVHYPRTSLVCVENTHNACGGKVLPLHFLKQLRELANQENIKIHLDGARLLNASVCLNIDVKEITQYADSVSLCFSKGLGAPMGSILAGSAEFIQKAHRLRKVLGGGLRQMYGMVSAAARYAYENANDTILRDHENALLIYKGLIELNTKFENSFFNLDIMEVQTNLVIFTVKEPFTGEQLCNLLESNREEYMIHGKHVTVKMLSLAKNQIRYVTNLDVTKSDCELCISKFEKVMTKLFDEKNLVVIHSALE